MPNAVLFANAHSGQGRDSLFEIADACDLLGINLLSTHFDLSKSGIARAIERARSHDVTVVIAAGGDGTIGSVLQYVAGTDLILGVVPAGTSNDFARSLQIPLSTHGAIKVIADDVKTLVDVGDVNGQLFGHAVTVGINTDFAGVADRLRKYLGPLSYPLACLQVYRERKPFTAFVDVSGTRSEVRAYQIAFVNAPVYGGPLELHVPSVELTDRSLQMVVIEDMRLRTLMTAIPVALWKRSLRIPGVRMLSIREASLETGTVKPVAVDGEVRTETPMTVRVLPQCLRVFVPRHFIQGFDARPTGR